MTPLSRDDSVISFGEQHSRGIQAFQKMVKVAQINHEALGLVIVSDPEQCNAQEIPKVALLH